MSAFVFRPERRPFPRWMGPFSPARGRYSGFRFCEGRLGTWVEGDAGSRFWPVEDGPGSRDIAYLVLREWGGGRVLLLPNGFVVKPLPGDEESGCRVLIGRFYGSVVLERPDGTRFDLESPGYLEPGNPWPGPKTTGLECTIDYSGTLTCTWCHPTQCGRDEVRERLRGPDRVLAAGFRRGRLGNSGGRVRITANGHVITNRKEVDDTWASIYVGYVDPRSWAGWEHWIEKERT